LAHLAALGTAERLGPTDFEHLYHAYDTEVNDDPDHVPVLTPIVDFTFAVPVMIGETLIDALTGGLIAAALIRIDVLVLEVIV
jgi:hypothetical protein